MSFNYYLLDVFTDQMFAGNQLAVFPDAEGIDPSLFQRIAQEFNLSETVFIDRSGNRKNHSMRIFTPAIELPTAGHPTIGAAYLLAKESRKRQIVLDQQIGEIPVSIEYIDEKPDLITMSQPLPVFGKIFEDRKTMAEVLSIDESDIADHPIQEVSCGNNVLLIPLRRVETLAELKIREHLLEQLSGQIENTMLYCFTINGVIHGDVQGRMFAPLAGISEDPATGSANAPLGCYLVRYGLLKMPVISLQGYEMGRPGQLYLDIKTGQNNEVVEVKVGGKCRLVGKGELFLSQ